MPVKIKQWYFVTKIVLTYREIFFSSTRTIYSNGESSEQFLEQNAFSTCSWRFFISNKLEQLKSKLEFRNMQEN